MRLLTIEQVAVAHDNAVVQAGVTTLLAQAGLRVVPLGESPRTGLAPDVVVADPATACRLGTAARGVVRLHAQRVLVVSTALDAAPLRRAVASGAAGVMILGDGSSDIVDAVRRVACTGTYRCSLARRVLEATDADAGLTPREAQVLASIVRGATNKSIAMELALSPNTVKTHVRAILDKLAVATRTHAVALALQRGLVPAVATTGRATSCVRTMSRAQLAAAAGPRR